MSTSSELQTDAPSVVLVSMPWTTLMEPSLGLGILKAKLEQEKIQNRVHHLNLFLLEYLSVRTYLALAGAFALNDFMFTYTVDPSFTVKQDMFLTDTIDRLFRSGQADSDKYPTPQALREAVLQIRKEVIPQYLMDCVEKIVSTRPTLVGFTCLFDQTIASVALAKMVRREIPDALIVFGGYALEGPVGKQIMKSFPWVDAVAFGEGEEIITPLARASVDRDLLVNIPDLLYRPASGTSYKRSSSGKPRIDLKTSPTPNFNDYALDLDIMSSKHQIIVEWDTIPIETSRGCWWGQMHHCVFCGIDDETLRYRQKTPEVVLGSFRELEERYSINSFRISDYILPHTYFKTLLPQLVEQGSPYTLSCEIKANMTSKKFDLMRQAGFVEVQPGIESFSTPVLKRMDKGVSGIQNIKSLLLGQANGIHIFYNILFGFPDDEESDYNELISTIPKLYHIRPPVSVVRVQMTRFAPLQSNPKRFGIEGPLQHHPRYHMLFSESFAEKVNFDYNDFCYYFDHPYYNSNGLEQLYGMLQVQTNYWVQEHQERQVVLSYEYTSKGIRFIDSRYSSDPRSFSFGSEHAIVYENMEDEITSLRKLSDTLSHQLSKHSIKDIIEDFYDKRLIYREGNRLLALALPSTCYDKDKKEHQDKWAPPYTEMPLPD